MKKPISLFLAGAIAFLMTFQTSCIGSFKLTKSYWDWCSGMEKWPGELVFLVTAWLVTPIALFVDSIILNSIEFWSGENPMSMNEGDIEKQVVMGKDGNTYEITATKNRFDIVQLSGDKSGEMRSMIFNPEDKSWSHENGCNLNKFAQYSNNGEFVSIYSEDGRMATIPTNISDKALAAQMIEEQMTSQTCMN